MRLLAEKAQDIDQEFVRWILYGMALAIIGLAGFLAWMIKKVFEQGPILTAALTMSTEALKENTEALQKHQESKS